MKLSTFAKEILLSPDLSSKLFMPRIDFTRSLAPEDFPNEPVRFSADTGSKSLPFPSSSDLKTDYGRAQALHFFANHELQAIELMSLMLLKFPGISPKLQRGLIATIKDEQLHFRLYEKRMAELGVKFGEIGVSRYFWDQLSGVNSIEEFMVGMSLTFEQANLDFALHYAKLFYQAGDEQTSTILKQVYEDEIRHVQLGICWANEWRGAKTLWDYHLQFIPGSMSPERAKGPVLDINSRIMAGFPRDYIASLGTYSRSKSRNPDLYWFNPDCTSECVGKVTKAGKQIEGDLATLMHVFAGSYNQVLVPAHPSKNFLVHLKDHNFPVPHFVTAEDLSKTGHWQPRALVPWGLSQRAKNLASLHTRKPVEFCSNSHVFSKSFATEVAQKLDPYRYSFICRNASELDNALIKIAQQGFSEAMIKTDFATSGQGNQIVPATNHKQGDAKELNYGRSWPTVAEPLFSKFLDLSSHASIDRTGSIKSYGETFFVTTKKGQYTGSFVGPRAASYIKKKLWKIDRLRYSMPKLQAMLNEAVAVSGKNLHQLGFTGPFSVDHFFYHDLEGRLCFRALVEINPRLTMGRVAYQLSERVSPQSFGFFRIKRSTNQPSNLANPDFTAANLCEFDELGKIKNGDVVLTDTWLSPKWTAELEVSENPELTVENNLSPLNIPD